MVQTLRACRELRPKAKWGYYGYFYGKQYPRALWEAMSMFNPQLYLYGAAPSNSSADHQRRRLGIAQIVESAVNISRQLEADGLPRPAVLPVGWQLYPTPPHLPLDDSDLASELLEPCFSGYHLYRLICLCLFFCLYRRDCLRDCLCLCLCVHMYRLEQVQQWRGRAHPLGRRP